MAKAKVATAKELDLNKWCVEMAIKWPQVMIGGAGMSGGVAYSGPTYQDADVVTRAERLLAWVRASH